MITRKVRALVNIHFAIFSGVPRPACTRVLNAIGGAVATMLAWLRCAFVHRFSADTKVPSATAHCRIKRSMHIAIHAKTIAPPAVFIVTASNTVEAGA